MLISHSDKDDAVGKAFPLAHDLTFFARLNPNTTSSTGLGATGPSTATTAAFLTNQQVAVAWGSCQTQHYLQMPVVFAKLSANMATLCANHNGFRLSCK